MLININIWINRLEEDGTHFNKTVQDDIQLAILNTLNWIHFFLTQIIYLSLSFPLFWWFFCKDNYFNSESKIYFHIANLSLIDPLGIIKTHYETLVYSLRFIMYLLFMHMRRTVETRTLSVGIPGPSILVSILPLN